LNQFKKTSGCVAMRGARDDPPATIRAAPVIAPAQFMDSTIRRLVFLRRLALICAAAVLTVTSLSAYIRLSKAGSGCADRPQCYGQSLRPLQQGVAPGTAEPAAIRGARAAHRVVALLALLLVVMMVTICFTARPVWRAEGSMALGLLALVAFLAVLGRWSSGARVPAVTIGNLLGGFSMVALSLRLALAGRPLAAVHLRPWAIVATLLLLAQVALGGLISAARAGLSCVDWVDCVKGARDVGWSTLDPWRVPVLSASAPFNPDGALAQALHRGLAVGLVLLASLLAVLAWQRGRPRSAAALLAVLAAQVTVGLAMVHGSLPLGLAMLHNGLAACLFAALVLLI
jgi:cytochrome c oxidase assembly protein subunit 15